MKAFLLAAGKGTRIQSVTNNKIPKCLLPISDKPLLEIWFELCQKHNINEILVNGHYLAKLVENFIKKNKNRFNLKIKYIYEKELKGTGGTIRNNFDFVRNEKYFYIFHADNYTNIDLTKFKKFHINHNSPLSIALFHVNNPEQCGIVEKINQNNLITAFVEKPKETNSNLASAAIFITSPKIFKDFPNKEKFDFSSEILPKYIGKMYGYTIKGFNIDIGTPKTFKYAQKKIK